MTEKKQTEKEPMNKQKEMSKSEEGQDRANHSGQQKSLEERKGEEQRQEQKQSGSPFSGSGTSGSKSPESKPSSEQQLEEMTDLLKRTQANFENYRKQVELRYRELSKFASKELILKILPIVDHFTLALKHDTLSGKNQIDLNQKDKNQKGENQKEFRQGIELIYAQLNNMLDDLGIKEIEAKEKYDPYLHEALMKVESDLPENSVIEVFQKGYIWHGQVIQHAKVKLSAGKKKTPDPKNDHGKKNDTNKK